MYVHDVISALSASRLVLNRAVTHNASPETSRSSQPNCGCRMCKVGSRGLSAARNTANVPSGFAEARSEGYSTDPVYRFGKGLEAAHSQRLELLYLLG